MSTPSVNLTIEEIQVAAQAGLQRQLRILGTLSRLHLRDGKSHRLPDLNKTLNFISETASRYEELEDFFQLVQKKIFPELNKVLRILK